MEILSTNRRAFSGEESPANAFGSASKFSSRIKPSLSFYRSAPHLEVCLEDFELFALDRLRVLKGLEETLSRGKKNEEIESMVSELWRKYMRASNAADTGRAPKMVPSDGDYSFSVSFRLETPESQRTFMEECKLPYKAISTTEFEAVKDKLGQVARSLNQALPNAESIFFKVPFEEVPELVSGRKIFLQRGHAFVPMSQITAIVVSQFRSCLSKALVLTNRKWTSTIAVQEKDRLTPIVETLSTWYLGPDYSQPTDNAEISLKDIDNLANSSFPLCMRHLFFKVKEDHHLKHGGRMQLGLFLKGVGLKLEDALAFWRTEFSKKVGVEKFDKEYSYSIRHNYGKEGKRTDYSPYSCQKIIMSTPGVGDHHGCPYRHFSDENLRAALGKMGVNARAVDDIMHKVRDRHYQVACTMTFEAVHACSCDTGVNHPNQYFRESQKFYKQRIQSLNLWDLQQLQAEKLITNCSLDS